MKRQMKRLLLSPLVLSLLCCSACGGSKQPADLSETTPAPVVVITFAPTATPMPKSSSVPIINPASEPLPLGTPEPSPEVTPESSPEVTPDVSPEPTEEPTAESSPEPSAEMTPLPSHEPYQGYAKIDETSAALLPECSDLGQAYLDSITFLGDSTTYGMKYYAVLSGGKNTTQVWTPSSGTLTLSYQGFAEIVYPEDDSEITIRAAVQKKLPERMIITLGVNGVSFMEQDYFISEYTNLVSDIQSLSPDTEIILQSIFPVAASYEYQSSINNEVIAQANTWILSIAESCGVTYLNTFSALLGSDGYLPENLQNGDGLHLNADGFAIVTNYIRTHGIQ